MERDHSAGGTHKLHKDFNSHAHVERDILIFINREKVNISTHTLTWSVTFGTALLPPEKSHFNSHAHVERDLVLHKPVETYGHFNSHAHVERDWLELWRRAMQDISTHTLTWSVTFCWGVFQLQKRFQLTRSRGA